MGFQVVLIDQVDSILVAEPVNQRAVRIVAGTDSVDIIALHRLKILAKLRLAHASSAHTAKFMAVHTLEHDSSSIQGHDIVLHLKPSETNLLRYYFLKRSRGIVNLDCQVIEIRLFCTPKRRPVHRP